MAATADALLEVAEPGWKKFSKSVIAGTFGGFAVVAVGHPLDTVKVRLQTQPAKAPLYTGTLDCVRKTLAAEGAAGLYRGVMSPLAGQLVFNSVNFAAWEGTQDAVRWLQGRAPGEQLPIPEVMAAAFATGFLVSFVESPIDLFKSQMQVQVFSRTAPEFRGVFHCAATVVRTYGLRGVFQGLAPTIARDCLGTLGYFGIYEVLKRQLVPTGQKGSAPVLVLCGGLAGTSYWLLSYPIDVVKSAMQGDSIHPAKRQYAGMMDCARQLAREGGAARFFRGAAPALLRAFPAIGACFLAYETAMDMLNKAY